MDSGLAGITAAETVMSHVDGERGLIWVRGHTIEDCIAHHGYEGTIALLWDGFAGDGLTRAGIQAELGAGRLRAFSNLDTWLGLVKGRPSLDGTRIALSALPEDSTPAEIAAALPVAIAAMVRQERGEAPIAPDPGLDTAADLLRMLHDAAAPKSHSDGLETYFTAVIDNGLNASTFTARIVASTRASLVAAATGGYCAFSGPIHGGAPGPTLDMLDEAEASGDVDAWLEAKLASGGRLMGFGHRVFRVRDPRADGLRASLQRIGSDTGRLAFAATLEEKAMAALERHKPGKRLKTNVEINAALLLDAVGLPREAFTPVFAIGRIAGWLAHAMEQRREGRLVRPGARYVGPTPGG